MQRHISEPGLALIQHFEGFQPHIYRCVGGYDTIGYGHVVRAHESFAQGITPREALKLLEEDVAQAEAAVDRLLAVPLSAGQFDALVSFCFNLGAGALQRSRLRQCVRRGEHEAARREFLRWIHAGGKPQRGLLRRRLAEATLYQTGQWA
ncbi:MAG: lysozyme [Rickettsiales bacterium]|nr:lysozyme [Rickettsiales bacterium]